MGGSFSRELVLDYFGLIDFQTKKELIAVLKYKLEQLEVPSKARKRCIYVLEELLSNAHEYYKKQDLSQEKIELKVELIERGVVDICISNTLLKSDTDAVKLRIDTVNMESQIRQSFQQTLMEDSGPDKEGAGLGFITMKLRAGLIYSVIIKEKNENHNIFNLNTTLKLDL